MGEIKVFTLIEGGIEVKASTSKAHPHVKIRGNKGEKKVVEKLQKGVSDEQIEQKMFEMFETLS